VNLNHRMKLEALFEDKVPFVQLNAAIAISKVGGSPESFVPVLVRCLHQGEEGSRAYAAYVLSNLGDRAISAAPDLIKSLNSSTNQEEQLLLLEALRGIDPDTALNFHLKVSKTLSPTQGDK
jgi:HEAT repeat protein